MAIFSVNQVTHVYPVTKGVKTVQDGKVTLDEGGQVALFAPTDKDYIYFKHTNALKEVVRTDIIKKANVLYTKLTLAAEMKTPLKKFKVALKSDVNGGAPVAGQDYLLRITIPQYGGMSDMHTQVKHGVVRATSGMDASAFYKTMASSLAKNFSRELAPIFKFYVMEGSGEETQYTEITATTKIDELTGTYTGICISEVEQEWVLGVKPYAPVMVTKDHIQPDAVIVEGEELIWGAVEDVTSDADAISNSMQIADLEYFSMGDRGDLYRNIGWPHVVPTKYLVNPTLEDGYDVINIHYAYVGPNECVQKSEKDMVFVLPAGQGEAFYTSIKTALGIE